MTLICTAQTLNNKIQKAENGFTLLEAMIAMAIVALLTSIAVFNLTEPIRKSNFEAQAQSFVSTMQQAAYAASETGKRYEVIVDLAEQQYILREISSDNLVEMLEEEIISVENLNESCSFNYVEFDDPEAKEVLMTENTETLQAKFRAGPGGWQYGGKIVLRDRSGRDHSVIVSTLTRIVRLVDGDVQYLESKRPDEVPF